MLYRLFFNLLIVILSHITAGVSFKQGAGDECAAAVALLLFGSSDTILPGGYAGEEVSANSPIVQVVFNLSQCAYHTVFLLFIVLFLLYTVGG